MECWFVLQLNINFTFPIFQFFKIELILYLLSNNS